MPRTILIWRFLLGNYLFFLTKNICDVNTIIPISQMSKEKLQVVTHRQKFIGFKVALDDEGTAKGWLFWDDGESIDTYGKGLYYLANFSASQNMMQSHIIFNKYITDSNPLKLGYVEIWGVGRVPISSVSISTSSMVIMPAFNYDPVTQVLSIDVTTRDISLHNFISLTWSTL